MVWQVILRTVYSLKAYNFRDEKTARNVNINVLPGLNHPTTQTNPYPFYHIVLDTGFGLVLGLWGTGWFIHKQSLHKIYTYAEYTLDIVLKVCSH